MALNTYRSGKHLKADHSPTKRIPQDAPTDVSTYEHRLPQPVDHVGKRDLFHTAILFYNPSCSQYSVTELLIDLGCLCNVFAMKETMQAFLSAKDMHQAGKQKCCSQ